MKATRAILSICCAVSLPSVSLAFSPPPNHFSRVPLTALGSSIKSQDSLQQIIKRLSIELTELGECSRILYSYVSKPEGGVTVEDVVKACDAVDENAAGAGKSSLPIHTKLNELHAAMCYCISVFRQHRI